MLYRCHFCLQLHCQHLFTFLLIYLFRTLMSCISSNVLGLQHNQGWGFQLFSQLKLSPFLDIFLKAQHMKCSWKLSTSNITALSWTLFLQNFPWWRRKCIRTKRYTSCPSSSIPSKHENKKRGLGHWVCGCNATILSAKKEKEERGTVKWPFLPSCYSPPLQVTQQDTWRLPHHVLFVKENIHIFSHVLNELLNKIIKHEWMIIVKSTMLNFFKSIQSVKLSKTIISDVAYFNFK